MRAGALRKRGTIEQPSLSAGIGEKTVTWSTFAALRYMAIEPLAGREFFAAKQVASEATCRIRLRFVAGIKPKMRVIVGTRIFDIEHVAIVDERNAEIHLLCREKIA